MSSRALFPEARQHYHAELLKEGVLCISERSKNGKTRLVPSNADGDSAASVAIAQAIVEQIQLETKTTARLKGQVAGSKFEHVTRQFLTTTFIALKSIRPGHWNCSPLHRAIFRYEQYRHLAALAELGRRNEEAAIHLGHYSDYIIAPDILIAREPEPDEVINSERYLVDDNVAQRASIRRRNNELPLLHASVSCKWTLRSDRAQNARSEALNLIRNRKGRVPHIVVVTGEPLPSRLASLVLGTGDIDCVYHFALPELLAAVKELGVEESINLMKIMTDGQRLKDITDLPLDLAV